MTRLFQLEVIIDVVQFVFQGDPLGVCFVQVVTHQLRQPKNLLRRLFVGIDHPRVNGIQGVEQKMRTDLHF